MYVAVVTVTQQGWFDLELESRLSTKTELDVELVSPIPLPEMLSPYKAFPSLLSTCFTRMVVLLIVCGR